MKIFRNVLLLLILANPIYGFAQGSGSVGGGRFSEAQLKDFMGELVKFFRDPQSKALFPEVKEWETANNQVFADFVAAIEPVVVNHRVYGPYGEERDCVSKVLMSGKRIFECNQEAIPENRLENQPLVYQMETHEAFVHAGIEQPTSKELPSTYEKSSRIGNTQNLSLVTYQKWVPKLNRQNEVRGIECEFKQVNHHLQRGRSIRVQAYNGNARAIIYRLLPMGKCEVGIPRGMCSTLRSYWEEYDLKFLKGELGLDGDRKNAELTFVDSGPNQVSFNIYFEVGKRIESMVITTVSSTGRKYSMYDGSCQEVIYSPYQNNPFHVEGSIYGDQSFTVKEKKRLLNRSMKWLKKVSQKR